MSTHPHVQVINRMTGAVLDGNKEAVAACFTDDMDFHVRGPLPKAGDHKGAEGFRDVIGTIIELTGGDLKIEQLFCIAEGDWASEWERAVLKRKGKTLDVQNAFTYRFEGGRIAEMWMVCAAPDELASFWD